MRRLTSVPWFARPFTSRPTASDARPSKRATGAPDGFVEARAVDVHVARLRGKFAAAKLEEPGIETVRGVGYRFKDKP